MQPKISVIIPIYNTKPYLRRCVDSILTQTLKDIEVILVDDGSTDGSASICDKYAQDDNRVTIIHKKNGGQASARNEGLEAATGTYISFVDSDDSIAPDMLELLFNKMEENGLDLTICNINVVKPEGIEKSSIQIDNDLIMNINTMGTMSYIFDYLLTTKHDCSACNKLFRRSIISEYTIRFPQTEAAIYEDAFFCIKYVLFTRLIGFVDKPLYFYYRERGDSSSRKPRLERFVYYVLNIEDLYTYLLTTNTLRELKALCPCLCLYFYGTGCYQLQPLVETEQAFYALVSQLNRMPFFKKNMRWLAFFNSSKYLIRYFGYSKKGAFVFRYDAFLCSIGKAEKSVKSMVHYENNQKA